MVTDHGIRAIKLYPTYDHFFPADEVCWPIYELAVALDIPVQIDMGWTPTINAPMKTLTASAPICWCRPTISPLRVALPT